MVIGIIGAGAAGMAAALAASENPNVQVLLFERQARVGRKLLATGNGRCNLTNMGADKGGYHGQEQDFSTAAIAAFPPRDTIAWFEGLGLITVCEDNGRVYPYSDQANSVVDVLRLALAKPNVRLLTGFEVSKAQKANDGFTLSNGTEEYHCNKLIVACGGLAGTKLGGSMSGYKLLAKFGHRSTRLRPALVQVKTAWGGVNSLKGVRANCHVQMLKDDTLFAESTGELQFTEYGLSGPVIFETSRDVCQGGGTWCCQMDFLPQADEKQLLEMLHKRRKTNLPVEELLTGILHNRLGRVLTKAAGIKSQGLVSDLSDRELADVCQIVKAFVLELSETLGMDSAQVTAGGVLTDGFCENTMESKIVPGLYACGEVLDVDGDCGGYNLQWAWSSGRMAGLHAGKENK